MDKFEMCSIKAKVQSCE